jgi:hypothetical protein
MRQTVFLFFLIITSTSCYKGDDSNILESKLESKSEVEIGGNKYLLSRELPANENCGFLFINIKQNNVNNVPYILEIKLSKKGDIIKVRLADNNQNYESSTFNPKESFNITSFQFDTLTNSLSFAFDGTLFVPYATESIKMKGIIDKIKVKPTACTTILSSLNADIDLSTGEKRKYFSAISSSESDNASYRQYFYSNDGYRVTFENKSGLWELSKGTYDINSESLLPLKVTFDKYLGLSDKNNFYLFINKEWKSYRLTGKIEIAEHNLQANGTKQTIGRLMFTSYDDNNKAIYFLKNGNFSIIGPP